MSASEVSISGAGILIAMGEYVAGMADGGGGLVRSVSRAPSLISEQPYETVS